MKRYKNIGTSDRWIRFVIAVALLGYACWKSSWIAFGLSLFVFAEAIFSWCLLYQILGKNSCNKR